MRTFFFATCSLVTMRLTAADESVETCTDEPSPFWLDLEKATPNIFAKYGFEFPRMAYIRKCFTWKQKERCYFLYVPESAQTGEAVPLVVDLHGGGGCANTAMITTGSYWAQAAKAKGLVVAFPQGYSNPDGEVTQWGKKGTPTEDATDYTGVKLTMGLWRHGDYCCGVDADTDDVGFIEQILAQEVAQNVQAQVSDAASDSGRPSYKIDASRFYVSGFSNGASMAQEVAFRKPELVAAVTAGALYLYEPDSVIDAALNATGGKLKPAVAVLEYHGDADKDLMASYASSVKYADTADKAGLPPFKTGFARNKAVWADINGCDAKPGSTSGQATSALAPTKSPTGFTLDTYSNCNDGVENKFITLEGVTHYDIGFYTDEIVAFALKYSKAGAATAIASVDVVPLTTNYYYSSAPITTGTLLLPLVTVLLAMNTFM